MLKSNKSDHALVKSGDGARQRTIRGGICCSLGRKIPSEMDVTELNTRKRIWVGTLAFMNFFAKVLLWSSGVATIAAVVWYSIELKNNG